MTTTIANLTASRTDARAGPKFQSLDLPVAADDGTEEKWVNWVIGGPRTSRSLTHYESITPNGAALPRLSLCLSRWAVPI